MIPGRADRRQQQAAAGQECSRTLLSRQKATCTVVLVVATGCSTRYDTDGERRSMSMKPAGEIMMACEN
jgi:hypothetical protein